MTLGAIGLAVVMLEIDRNYTAPWVRSVGWLYQGSAQGARSVLSTVAGSMATVAGVVFSIMIVVLSLASSQFGPRLVRNFLSDAGSGLVFGTFIGTFTYSLLVLRSIRASSEGGSAFVPQLSVSLGVLIAVIALGVLIYFIHHVASMIQVESVVRSASANVRQALDARFLSEVGQDADRSGLDLTGRRCAEVTTERGGYIQDIDGEGIFGIAEEHDLVVELPARPGDFVEPGAVLARVWTRQPPNSEVTRDLRGRFFVGAARTPRHDLIAAINQLVEIAARALSPGINDPFTAVTCIDHLAAALIRLAEAPYPSSYRRDGDGVIRLTATSYGFAEVVRAAVGPIRHYGHSSPLILADLLRALDRIGSRSRDPEVLAPLVEQARAIAQECRRAAMASMDCDDVLEQYRRTLESLGEEGGDSA